MYLLHNAVKTNCDVQFFGTSCLLEYINLSGHVLHLGRAFDVLGPKPNSALVILNASQAGESFMLNLSPCTPVKRRGGIY